MSDRDDEDDDDKGEKTDTASGQSADSSATTFEQKLHMTQDRYGQPGPDNSSSQDKALVVDANSAELTISIWNKWNNTDFTLDDGQVERVMKVLSDWANRTR